MKQVLISLLIMIAGTAMGIAQPVLTPLNMALGGGGSTYITDFNASFYNPANLFILENERNFTIGIGISGLYSDRLLNYQSLDTQVNSIRDHFEIYQPGAFPVNNAMREQIVRDNYPGKNTLSGNRMRNDITLSGIKWHRNDRSYSLALRSRSSTSYRVGLGWYDTAPKMNSSGNEIVDRSLIYRHQSMYELSFGYAESFEFLTGLTPRLDNFMIGIAPKLILGTNYAEAVWQNTYQRQGSSTMANRTQSFRYSSTGEHAEAVSGYLSGIPLDQANTVFSKDPFDINGIGAGLDIGVTYLLTFGDNLSTIRREGQPSRRSLRVSFSMTDIGLISYNSNDLSLSPSGSSSDSVSFPKRIATELFSGSKGQYLYFIEQFGESNPFTANTQPDESTFSTLLPMALHGGAFLEIDRVKLMADISIGLTNNAFNSTKPLTSFGMEIRPFSFLPIRGGIQFEAQRPDFISAGTAIETDRFDVSIAALFKPTSLSEKPSLTGAVVSALRFHF